MECIQQLPRVWSDLQTPTMAGNFQCCTHHETNLAVRHEGDTRVLGSTICDNHHYVLLGCSVHQHQVYLWVLDSSNGPGGKNQLLPGLLQVDDVDTIGLLLEDVLLHRGLAVVRPDVGGGSQHLGNVILLGIEAGVRITKEGKQGTYHMLQDASSDYKLASNVDQTAFPILDHHY